MREITRDVHGIIGQVQQGTWDKWVEGGDSAAWNGYYSYFSKDTKTLPYVKTFEIGFGAYVRHPVPVATNNKFGAYYNNPWDGCISRDQLGGILLGIIAERDYLAMLRLMLHWSLRLFLFSYNTIQNGEDTTKTKFSIFKFFYNPEQENYYKMPDLTFFNMWGLALRGFGVMSWIFWPLLVVFDIHMLADAMLANKDDNKSINSHLGRLHVATKVAPTPLSYLSRKLANKQVFKKKAEHYWAGKRVNPGISDLMQKAIEKL